MKFRLLLILIFPFFATAQLSVAKIFSDNMVLQRGQLVHLWGKATPAKKVSVTFKKKIITTIAKNDSAWSVYFPKQEADTYSLEILIQSGTESITLKNILIGDIWVCAGQSNMEWPMVKEMHFKEEINHADQPLIRLYNPSPAGRYVYGVAYNDSLNKRLNEDDFYEHVQWQHCDSNTVKDMSAVAYYFAKTIITNEKVPIGLIHLAIGGAPIETFISRDALQNSKQFAEKARGNWLENKSLPNWVRQRGNENIGANKNFGYKDDLGLNHAYKPGFAFRCGFRPILPLPIKGVIWYQGESNSLEKERVVEYKDLQKLLINDYRSKRKQPGMPFYWVQLSSIDTASYGSQYWPEFRNEQRKLLSEVTNGGMAVCSDIGFKNNVHPTDKKTVGERLARWALNKTYFHKEVIPSGPLPLTAKYKNNKVIVSFQYTGDGLQTADDTIIRGFSIDGKKDVSATIQQNAVIIKVISKPEYIYYGWKPFTDANLVNSEGLPASTFKINVQ